MISLFEDASTYEGGLSVIQDVDSPSQEEGKAKLRRKHWMMSKKGKTYKTDKICEEENELDDICTAAHLEASTGFNK